MNHELWPHQQETLTALRQSVGQGVKRIVVQSPTGSGKTGLAAAIVESATAKGKRVAFVVPAISLVSQTVEMFWNEGIKDVGVIQADHEMTDWSKPVQICSIQTIARRNVFPAAHIVIIDECHTLYEAHKKWMTDAAWAAVPFIGLSATPYTRGLGHYFATMIVAATIGELIDKGFLSKFRAFATGHPDLKDVKIVAGDYHEGQLSQAMQQGTLVADVVETWKQRWGQDKTFVFGVDCLHAQALQQRFLEAGIVCGYQDANTPDSERREFKRKFHNGELRVLANVGTLTTGVDYDVRCLVLARPTRSESLYQQIVGRALRTAPGKEYAVILDHSDTTSRLGLVTDIHHDHLDDGKARVNGAERKAPLPKPCPSCAFLKPARVRTCPNCGFEAKPVSGITESEGELSEILPGQRPKKNGKHELSYEQRREFFVQLLGYAEMKGRKRGWAAHTYKEKFGCWPDWSCNTTAAKEPGMLVLSYIKSRNIAWANSHRRAEAAE
jgi:superfamily II DNA or RNA helicase